MADIAFIGTGLLGSGMVERMLGRGHRVTVWNRTTSKAQRLEPFGARVAASPASAVEGAERIHLALPDDTVVESVLEAIRPSLGPDSLVVDHSTTLPARTKERVARASRDGIRYLHAPVFMAPQAAREGKGMMLVAGPSALFERARPSMEEMTGAVWYLGERGDLAAAYKLFGNSMLFTLAGGIADVIALARATGIDPAEAVRLFERFPIASMIPTRGAKMAAGDYTASFEMTMARKDVQLMLETAGERRLTVLPALAARMDEAIADGHGADDMGAIAAEPATD